MSIALAVMTRAPSARDGKTRLLAALRSCGFDSSADGLPCCLLRDTLEVVGRVPGVRPVILYTPAGAERELLGLAPFPPRLLRQRGGDLGERMHAGFVDLLTPPTEGALLIGSDLPSLPVEHLVAAVDALSCAGDRMVLGPAADGGYYLVGLKQPHPELFENVAWGTDAVFAETRRIAARLGLDVATLPEWYDVDDGEGLARLLREAPGPAPHTRAWLEAHRI